MKMKTYKIGNKSYMDEVQKGVFVVKLKGRLYYVAQSEFIAKTMREWQHGMNLNHILIANPPQKLVDIFLYNPRRNPNYNTSQGRVLLTMCANAHHDSIYYNYIQKYGHDQVRSSNHLYFGEVTFEKKTQLILENAKPYKYSELIGGTKNA